ncbi:hypothetical protein PIROE2DRAFT_65374 [Piromyces sp. E2]|nr:hypothetical protein PIROE2DRAFT_65374 [Piromyces sp. E2]|eukprot:OUM56772.1 hypothetical protein PIROE2DRAFT_65374 [Piromyces sp. E2]
MTVYDYVLKSDSLISYSYFLTLVKLAYPDVSDWNLVLTFSYPENQRDVSGIPNNPIYGAFVSKEDKLIIDVYCETTNVFGGLQSFKELMKMNIEQQKDIYDKNKRDNVVNMSQVVTLYTFDREFLYNEFLESYMAGEKLQYELKHKINTPKTKSKSKSKSLESSSSSLSLKLDDDITTESKKEVKKQNNKDSIEQENKKDTLEESNTSNLKKRNVKKGKEVKVEEIPLKPNENKKPDNAFMKKFKVIRKTRAYRTIENIILFFIIFFFVRHYSAIVGFIYKKAFSLSREAFKLLKSESDDDKYSKYSKYENYYS